MYQSEYCPKCGKKTLREIYPCACQNTSSNSDYENCSKEIFDTLFYNHDYSYKEKIESIIKKHFA